MNSLSADLERLAKKEAYQNIKLTLLAAGAELDEQTAHANFYYDAANEQRGIVNRVRALCMLPDPKGGIEDFRHVDDILAIIGDERYDEQGHAGNGPE